MKEIDLKNQKKILVDMLKFITNICDENEINYTLIGGSLIGSIRHKGFIPWDDDIDIVFMPSEIKKLLKVLPNYLENSNFLLLNPFKDKDYYYPFYKLVDTRTVLKETKVKELDNYGVYLDMFEYHYVSNISLFRFLHYNFLSLVKQLLNASTLNNKTVMEEKNILKKIRYRVSWIIGTKRLMGIYLYICKDHKETDYVLYNWLAYGYKKEIQNASDFKEYKKVKFENIDAMITKNYDNVLKTTFGDYMKMPPKERRVSNHDFVAYWRDNNEK